MRGFVGARNKENTETKWNSRHGGGEKFKILTAMESTRGFDLRAPRRPYPTNSAVVRLLTSPPLTLEYNLQR